MVVANRIEAVHASKWVACRATSWMGESSPRERARDGVSESSARDWTPRAGGTCHSGSTGSHGARCQPHPPLQAITSSGTSPVDIAWVSQILWQNVEVVSLNVDTLVTYDCSALHLFVFHTHLLMCHWETTCVCMLILIRFRGVRFRFAKIGGSVSVLQN